MSKVDAIKKINTLAKVRDINRLMELANYYNEMWHNRAHTLATLTKSSYTKVNFEYTDVEHNYLKEMNRMLERDVLLS